MSLDTISPALHIVGYALLLLLPSAAVVFTFARQRKRDDAAAVAPFTEMRRRPAGESLRLKLQELDGKVDEWLLLLVTTPIILAIALTFARAPSLSALLIFFLAAAAAAAFVQSRLRPLLKERRNYKLGFQGERFVAEELNQLLRDGYEIFHDAPFGTYNIDHVLVGPNGVFAVETKTRRKPFSEAGEKQYKVSLTGEALQFPNCRDTDSVDQIRRNVKSLAQWLTSATGDRTTVVGIIAIPGWSVTPYADAELIVINPRQARSYIVGRSGARLDPAQIQRACHQLEERCKLPI